MRGTHSFSRRPPSPSSSLHLLSFSKRGFSHHFITERERENERKRVWSVSIPCPVTIIHSSFLSREVVIRFSIILFRYFSLFFSLFLSSSLFLLKVREGGKDGFQHVMTTSCFTLFPPPFFSCHEFLLLQNYFETKLPVREGEKEKEEEESIRRERE